MNGNSQFSWTFATSGMHTVTFVVDADNHVPESNEGDNSVARTFIVCLTAIGTNGQINAI